MKNGAGEIMESACLSCPEIVNPRIAAMFIKKVNHIHGILHVYEVTELFAILVIRPVGPE
jgi:hypothetical protein